MARKRVLRSAGTKAKVALAAVAGMSPSQIANRFGVHPTQVATWKKYLLEEAETLSAIAAGHGLDLVLLVAPTTPPERMARIAASSRGFTYLVSVTGVTGVRTTIESRVADLVRQLKALGPTPVAVGFGISGPEQARQVRDWGADGAIVGSALVKVMAEADASQQDVAAAAGGFCTELRRALDA